MSMLFLLHPWENSSLNYLLHFYEFKGGPIISVLSGQRIEVSDVTNRCHLLCFCCSVYICLLRLHPEFTSGKRITATCFRKRENNTAHYIFETLSTLLTASPFTKRGKKKKTLEKECIIINSGSSNVIIISPCFAQVYKGNSWMQDFIIEAECKYFNTDITLVNTIWIELLCNDGRIQNQQTCVFIHRSR